MRATATGLLLTPGVLFLLVVTGDATGREFALCAVVFFAMFNIYALVTCVTGMWQRRAMKQLRVLPSD